MIGSPLARWSALGRSTRLRAIGTAVLVCGLAGAVVFYWRATHAAAPTIEQLMPGYAQARQRQIGIMLGTFGQTLMEGLDELKEPRNEAILIAAASALAAMGCFGIARLMDLPEQNRVLQLPPKERPDE